jgi:hypothetical protein
MSSEVTELITALRAGTLTLDEVARRFRERSWPDLATAPPQNASERAARSLADPPPYIPGSFDDVLAAYDRHDLTLDEYRILAEAAAASIDAEDRELPHRDEIPDPG